MLHLVDKGLCKLEDLVVDHWPEFGAEGKGAIRITELLSHRAGLSYLDTPITVEMIEQASTWSTTSNRCSLTASLPRSSGTCHTGKHSSTCSCGAEALVAAVRGQTRLLAHHCRLLSLAARSTH
jgi:CubicO group peptidase (beta-lactamase class C family)